MSSMTQKEISTSLFDECQRLKGCITELEDDKYWLEKACVHSYDAWCRADDRVAEIAAQLEAVKPYVRHHEHCKKGQRSDGWLISPCTCGYSKAIGEVDVER